MRKRSGSILLMLIGAFTPIVADAAVLQCASRPAHIIVMRHGCKAVQDPANPIADKELPLCASGYAQAKELVERVADYAISTIYVTTKRRSRETAAELGIKPMNPAILPTDVAAKKLMETICLNPKSTGQGILYVGHSESLPGVFEAFGLSQVAAPRYADGWIISFDEHGKPTREVLPGLVSACGDGCAP